MNAHQGNDGTVARQVAPLGDSAVLVAFDNGPGESPCACIQGFCMAVQACAWPFVRELVPALRSVCIHYEPLRLREYGWTPGA